MKTLIAITSLLIASSAFAANSDQRETRADNPPAAGRLFAKIDTDRNDHVDEAELATALFKRDEHQIARINQLQKTGSPRAVVALARFEAEKSDLMLATPEKASGFIVANFDRDGDWELNEAELMTAFRSLHKWQETTRDTRI
ncbi:hypothetical protein [Pelagicoccus albus]|uniref:EF-hand domain-containing protein n=1 Tax=Pelagicoccus albus TaxID=415222 RepID=A0A7X1B7X6_9BACT|nr:hypothetical protein [Pelagicoccus albus]MBC2607300.1 hypothetical protein [Pelagicoccus albus]